MNVPAAVEQDRSALFSLTESSLKKSKPITCMYCQVSTNNETLDCGHQACSQCLNRFVAISIKSGNPSRQLVCCRCKNPFTENDINRLITNPSLLDNLKAAVTKNQILTHAHGKQCPTPDCDSVYLDNEPSDVFKEKTCTSCNQTYCEHCLIKHNYLLSCKQAKEAQLKDHATEQSEQWKVQNTKLCPNPEVNCGAHIEKSGGCDHMTCAQCGYEFCWLCLQKYWTGHEAAHSPKLPRMLGLLVSSRITPTASVLPVNSARTVETVLNN